jgi:hypothetical protein
MVLGHVGRFGRCVDIKFPIIFEKYNVVKIGDFGTIF